MIGLILLLGAILFEAIAVLLAGNRITPLSMSWTRPVALLGLMFVGLFGAGPGLAAGLRRRLDHSVFNLWPGRHSGQTATPYLDSLGYAVTAAVFFILFCLAAFVSAETRILDHTVRTLNWPLWVMQCTLVVAFGGNVVRYSIFAADASLRRYPEPHLDSVVRFKQLFAPTR